MISFRAVKLYGYILLFFGVLITFVPCVGNDFVNWDDLAFVTENNYISHLSLKSLLWMLTTFYQGAWHPLTWFSHALDRAFWGINPWNHHLVSVVIHALNVILFCALFVKLQEGKEISDESRFIAAFTAALLFGVHPLRVEPVAWASARKDVLSAFFFLCALIVYVDFVRAESGGSRRAYYILTLFLSLLALLSKPTAMTLPFVLFVLDFYPLSRLERGTLGRLTLEKAPFLLLAAGAMAMNFFAARDVAVTLDYVPASVRIMNSFYAIIFYISRSIFPANLIPLYMMNRDLDYFGPVYVTSAVLVMAATVICIWRAMKNDRLWAAVWFYYLITLAPTLGFFMSFRHYVADRYSYLPTMAWWVLAGLAAARLWEAAGKVRHGPAFRAGLKVLWAGCFVLLAFLYGYCTESQIRVWKNTETLWQYVIDKADYIPDLAYAALGDDLERKGELDKALSHFQKAFSLNPRNNIFRGKVADILAKQGQKEEALAIHEAIRDVEPKNPWAHANVGRMLAMMGRHDEAIEALKKALELQPDYGNALLMLSAVYLETKDRTQALYYYNKYVSEGFPRRPGLERELGILPGSADKDR